MEDMDIERRDLKGMTTAELEAFFSSWGKERYRARQVSRWIYGRFVEDFAWMTDLSRAFRAELAAACRISSPAVEAIEVSSDGTEKYLFRLEDGESVESVLIPDGERRTLCISSQVGCALRCAFCATGASGFRRNMTSAEIVHQVCFAAKRLSERGETISNVVFMGMGEPLSNFSAVTHAVRTLASAWGPWISARKITISTVGLPRAIERLADEMDLPVTLALSLHAPNDALRRELIPWANYTTINELLGACSKWFEKTGREITLEYIMLGGVNDREQHARELADVARTLRANVNLIRYNEVAGLPFKRPGTEDVRRFQEVLRTRRINTHIRASRGRDIAAACGQLRHEAAAKAG